MLRDSIKTYNLPAKDDLSIDPNQEILSIIRFMDRSVPAFRPYYLEIKDSEKENRISDFLVYHLNCWLDDTEFEGYPPFLFGKNPTQASSSKETDIGVLIRTRGSKPITIIEFEAKRLSETSANKEYVFGKRGGIERFKKEEHGDHLCICGMFGYVQDNTIKHWTDKINNWIEIQSTISDSNNWKSSDEKLIQEDEFENVEKWTSVHSRITREKLRLYHYFINLT